MTAAERRESFIHQPVGPRAAIVVAGPVANFLLAIVIFAGLFMIYGKQSTAARVDTVQPDSAARSGRISAGRPGRLSINGRAIESFSEMQRIVSTSAGETLTSKSIAADARRHAQGDAGAQGDEGQFRQRASHGRARNHAVAVAGGVQFRRSSPLHGGWLGVQRDLVRGRAHAVLSSAAVIVGREAADQLGGPIRIAQVSGQVATDGSAALFILLRCFRSRSVCSICFRCRCSMADTFCSTRSRRCGASRCRSGRRKSGFRIGLAMVLMLMIFATYNDILHLAAHWAAS